MSIAICVIAYNRLDSFSRCIQSLDESHYQDYVKLYISVDKSDSDVVEKYAFDYKWLHGEKEVILHSENLGLRKHVLSCGNLLEKHDALIVLEDDIVVAPGFYQYAKQAVEKFQNDDNIAGISLYNFPISYHSWQPFTSLASNSDVYLMQNAQSWGQIWMKKQWKEFKEWYDTNNEEFEEKSYLPKSICSWPKSSWLKYHTRYCIEQNKYFVYPYKSYSTCFSDAGVHTSVSSPRFQTSLSSGNIGVIKLEPVVKYDSFFENTAIYDWLQLPQDDLCVDYYGDKGNRENKRFWLSREVLPYKIIKSFGLVMKPYELNIKYQIQGNDLFLYDVTVKAKSIILDAIKDRQFFYMYGTDRITSNKVFDAYFGKWTSLFLFEMKIINRIRAIYYKFKL